MGGGDEQLPLSEHEQRILHELEQSLYQEDPDFAERVRSETVYRHAGRYCIWSALVFVAALVFMFFTFSDRSFWASSESLSCSCPVSSLPTMPAAWAKPGSMTSHAPCTAGTSVQRSMILVTGSAGAFTETTDRTCRLRLRRANRAPRRSHPMRS